MRQSDFCFCGLALRGRYEQCHATPGDYPVLLRLLRHGNEKAAVKLFSLYLMLRERRCAGRIWFGVKRCC
jgi:hypothetical protein